MCGLSSSYRSLDIGDVPNLGFFLIGMSAGSVFFCARLLDHRLALILPRWACGNDLRRPSYPSLHSSCARATPAWAFGCQAPDVGALANL